MPERDPGPHDPAPQVAGVVLAAGAGRRMGGPKATLHLDGVPLVRRAVTALQDGGCAPTAAVVGASGGPVADLLSDTSVQVLDNPDWGLGMSTSVGVALRWAREVGADAVVMLPVDTPGIGHAVVKRLRLSWIHHGGSGAVATYEGMPRNPAVLAREVLEDVIAGLSGDTGARDWIAANIDRLVMVGCDDIGDPRDLDTPADVQRWMASSPPV